MRTRASIVATAAAAMLAVAIAFPSLAAAPTYSGTISCENVEGSMTTFSSLSGLTPQAITQFKKDHLGSAPDECAGMGAYDTSNLFRDP